MRPVKKGSTDQSIVIRIIDSTTGLPEEGVEHDTSGISLWYRREAATKTAITPAALAALDSAHSDGGIEHIDDGYYRLDLPDAAVASGVNGVMIGGTVTGMIVIGVYIPLVDYDPYDSVRMGMTALPNAAADAAGGLPISDAGGLDLDTQIGTDIDAILADTNELQGDWANGGRLDLIVDAILEDTGTTLDGKVDTIDGIVDSILEDTGTTLNDKIDTIDGNVDSILEDSNDTIPGLIAALNNISAADVWAVDPSEASVGAAPDTASKFLQGIWNRLFKKRTVTADTETAYETDNSTPMEAWTLADDDTTVSRAP